MMWGMTTTLKVRVVTTVEIDAESWAMEYGCEPSEVRADVQRHLSDSMRQQVETLGLGR